MRTANGEILAGDYIGGGFAWQTPMPGAQQIRSSLDDAASSFFSSCPLGTQTVRLC